MEVFTVKVGDAFKSSESLEAATCYITSLESILVDLPSPGKQAMLTIAQGLQKLLAMWSKHMGEDSSGLGFSCLEFSRMLMNLLMLAKSPEDENKGLKVVSFSILNALKMTSSYELLLAFVTATCKCLSPSQAVGTVDIRGKCVAHLLQLCGQLSNKLKSQRSLQGIQDLAKIICTISQSEYVDSIEHSSLSAEEKSKLFAYCIDNFVVFSSYNGVEDSDSSAILKNTLYCLHRKDVCGSKALDQVLKHSTFLAKLDAQSSSNQIYDSYDKFIVNFATQVARNISTEHLKIFHNETVACKWIHLFATVLLPHSNPLVSKSIEEIWRLLHLEYVKEMSSARAQYASSALDWCIRGILHFRSLSLGIKSSLLSTDAVSFELDEASIDISFISAADALRFVLNHQACECRMNLQQYLFAIREYLQKPSASPVAFDQIINTLRYSFSMLQKVELNSISNSEKQSAHTLYIQTICFELTNICTLLLSQLQTVQNSHSEVLFGNLLILMKNFLSVGVKLTNPTGSVTSDTIHSADGPQVLLSAVTNMNKFVLWKVSTTVISSDVLNTKAITDLLLTNLLISNVVAGRAASNVKSLPNDLSSSLGSLKRVCSLLEGFDTIANSFGSCGIDAPFKDFKVQEQLTKLLGNAIDTIEGVITGGHETIDENISIEINLILKGVFGKWIFCGVVHQLQTVVSVENYEYCKEFISRHYSRIETSATNSKDILLLMLQTSLCNGSSKCFREEMKSTLDALKPLLFQDSKFLKGKTKSTANTLPFQDIYSSTLVFALNVCLIEIVSSENGQSIQSIVPNVAELAANALKYLTLSLSLLENQNSSVNITCLGVLGSSDWTFLAWNMPIAIAKLFQYSLLFGRAADQQQIVTITTKLLAIISVSNSSSLQLSMYRSLMEVVLIDQMKCLYDNTNPIELVRERYQLLSSADNRHCNELSQWLEQVFRFVDHCRPLLASSHQLPPNHSTDAIMQLSNSLIAECPSSRDMVIVRTGSSDASYFPSMLLLTKVWILLLSAKCLSYVYGKHELSIERAWRALALLANIRNPTASSTVHASVYARAEAFILIGELFEAAGGLELAVSYFSEALSLTKSNPTFRALKSITEFHSCRIWFRASSSRFVLVLSGLADEDSSMIGQPEYESDVVSKKIRLAAKSLMSILRLEEDDKGQGSSIVHSRQHLEFRRFDLVWDIEIQARRPLDLINGQPDVNSIAFAYHSPMGIQLRQQINNYFDVRLQKGTEHVLNQSLCSFSSSKCSINSNENIELIKDILNELHEKNVTFDAKRDFYRLGCMSLLGNKDQLSAYQSFLLGISSIGISHQLNSNLQAICKGHNSSLPSLGSSASGRLLINEKNMQEIESSLKSLASETLPDSSLILVFACIEPLHGSLLIGRLDLQNQQPLVVSLPIGAQLSALIHSWEALMIKQKQQLQTTAADIKIDKWTEKDKRNWWKERMNVDNEIESLLQKFEDLLGPWKCLLFPKSTQTESNNSDETSISALLEKCSLTDDNMAANVKDKKPKTKKASGTVPNSMAAPITAWTNYFKAVCNDSDARYLLSEGDLNELLSSVCESSEGRSEQANEGLVRDIRSSSFSKPIRSPSAVANLTKSFASSATAVGNYDLAALSAMSMVELKEVLKSLGVEATARKKSDLVDKILAATAGSTQSETTTAQTETRAESRTTPNTGHMILFLDERLQQIPIESIPYLKKSDCSRLSSFSSLLQLASKSEAAVATTTTSNAPISQLASKKKGTQRQDEPIAHSSNSGRSVQLEKCWYVLDPESNLPTTRETMAAFIEPYSTRWKWKGTVASMPDQATLRSRMEESDLFIYCGHGAGEAICESHKLRKLKCPLASWLWGCSSGRLRRQGVHDPTGPVLDYLDGGSCQIVANLWDVTDKDIDKLSIECMKNVFDEKENSNACRSLAQARDVCKLKSAVGSAPVVYGLPMHFTGR